MTQQTASNTKLIQKVAGTDFDFDKFDIAQGEARIDILEQLRHLAQFLDKAVSAQAIFVGDLETKNATRVRIKIIFEDIL